MTQDSPLRRVVRVRHELRRRELEVTEATQLSPGFLSVTFGGESLADFVSESFDDHVKFLIPGDNGELVGRDYTPRSFSQAERRLSIEFAMHGDGPVDRWAQQAQQAQPGQKVVIGGPRGSMIIPTDYDWHLLAGDSSALPAIARRLEELPPAARVTVVAQVAEADRRALASKAQIDLHWVASSEQLLDAVQQLPTRAGDGFAWAAGEAAVMARLRDVLLREKQHPRGSARIAAYWKKGASGHHETLDTQ